MEADFKGLYEFLDVKSKGQAAIEYLTVFGIALLLSTPFILRAQASIFDMKSGSNVLQVRNSVDKLESSVQTVSASGEPARRTFLFELPDSVESSDVVNNSVVFSMRTRSGTSDIIRSFEMNITGDVPSDPGRHRLTVYAKDGQTHVEVVE